MPVGDSICKRDGLISGMEGMEVKQAAKKSSQKSEI